jgi:hypothetical protein
MSHHSQTPQEAAGELRKIAKALRNTAKALDGLARFAEIRDEAVSSALLERDQKIYAGVHQTLEHCALLMQGAGYGAGLHHHYEFLTGKLVRFKDPEDNRKERQEPTGEQVR